MYVMNIFVHNFLLVLLCKFISISREQEFLKSQLVQEDSEDVLSWRKGDDHFDGLHHIAGVDISFSKDNPNNACAMLTVLTFPDLEVCMYVHNILSNLDSISPFIASN